MIFKQNKGPPIWFNRKHVHCINSHCLFKAYKLRLAKSYHVTATNLPPMPCVWNLQHLLLKTLFQLLHQRFQLLKWRIQTVKWGHYTCNIWCKSRRNLISPQVNPIYWSNWRAADKQVSWEHQWSFNRGANNYFALRRTCFVFDKWISLNVRL